MQGRVVRLSHPTDDDYALISEWLAPDGAIAPLTGDMAAQPTVEDLKKLDSGSQRLFVIRRLADDEPVGTINYRRESAGCFSLGGAVGDPALWHSGYAGDAFIILIDHIFHIKNARRLQCIVMLFNKHSIRMMINSGFVCEGVLREYCYLDGSWHDATMWSLLRSEFYAIAERQARVSDRLRLRDMVPEEDKQEARRLFANYLRSTRTDTAISRFLDEEPGEKRGGPSQVLEGPSDRSEGGSQ